MKSCIVSQGLPRVVHSALATELGGEVWEHFTRFKDSVNLQRCSWHSLQGARLALGWDLQHELVRGFPASGR